MTPRPAVYVVVTPGGWYRAPGHPALRGGCPEGYTPDLDLAERYTEAGAAWLAGPGDRVVHESEETREGAVA